MDGNTVTGGNRACRVYFVKEAADSYSLDISDLGL
jgi:hypothetical protein